LGEPVVTRGLGGLVSVLAELFRSMPGTWVAAAQSDEEYALAEQAKAVEVQLDDVPYRVRYVAPTREQYRKYYNIIANPMLWFVQHYLWDLAWHPNMTWQEYDAWREGYLPVNDLFAAAVADEAGGDGSDALVMMHDYHLYCAPPLVRRRIPKAFLHQFIHIPWPQSDAWRAVPREVRTAVFEGLLANEIVAFHTEHYVENFLRGCEDVLEAPVDMEGRSVTIGEREVWVRAYPVSVDPEVLRAAIRSPRVAAEERALLADRPEFLLLRVDRLDPSKNILRGFLALDRFLHLHPEFAGRVVFLALLQPSRQDVEEYLVHRMRVVGTAQEINARHARGDWRPIDLRIQDNYPATLAAYRNYDVLFVNAIFDGMNLVAKEGAIVNRRDGVLVLSENTGAASELGTYSITVNPFDLEEQADAIFRALTMPQNDRRVLRQGICSVVEHNSVERWISTQLDDIALKEQVMG
jgi:trehalose 6-phosphate synthase